MAEKEVILSVSGLKKQFPIKNSALLPQKRKVVHAVDGVDFEIYRGETLGLVGESGCGKSTVGRLLVGIDQPTEGSILYRPAQAEQPIDLAKLESGSVRKYRTQLQMIFQDPYSSLNPRKRIYDILSEPMLYHGLVTKEAASARVDELLDQVGLPKNAKLRYPHEFSGGQRQRITIARALSLNPEVIVCDEPVSALDMSIQAQILNLLRQLQKDLGVTYLFIAHGLGAVHYVSTRTAVMYLGKIVEIGDAGEVFRHPVHPYSKMLIGAVPVADPTKRTETVLQTGEVPSAIDLPKGCRFASRCPYADDKCRASMPEPVDVSAITGAAAQHLVSCHKAQELAQKGGLA